MTKFTDDKGAEYEVITGWHHAHPKDGEYVIRPVKVEPYWKVRVVDDAWEDDDRAIEVYLGKTSTKDQAQLIKEAVEALMVEINKPPPRVLTSNSTFNMTLYDAIDKARKALKEE